MRTTIRKESVMKLKEYMDRHPEEENRMLVVSIIEAVIETALDSTSNVACEMLKGVTEPEFVDALYESDCSCPEDIMYTVLYSRALEHELSCVSEE
jgi:hypothetical protein